ncbi:hypothetical protein [Haloarchaeobius sp. DFWS5]|uniref:hypothetical protein n=1 Tax=Haloarchaeobius sp. DFWS5 TaxID=3446114 RepID=UPI003EBB520D
MVPTFPVERVPDGIAAAPHHLYIGALVTLVACMVVWDDEPEREPLVVVCGVLVALFGFASVWPYLSPRVGAAMTLVGLVGALAALAFRRSYWGAQSRVVQVVVVVGLVIALDDAVSHALYPPTPLDLLFHRGMLPVGRWLDGFL